MGGDLYSLTFYIKLALVSFLWIWVRGTLPRFRYDKLIYLAWKRFLPCSLLYIYFFLRLKIGIFIINL
jgi:NADH-ubiquinone oxidoreductase chain 1